MIRCKRAGCQYYAFAMSHGADNEGSLLHVWRRHDCPYGPHARGMDPMANISRHP